MLVKGCKITENLLYGESAQNPYVCRRSIDRKEPFSAILTDKKTKYTPNTFRYALNDMHYMSFDFFQFNFADKLIFYLPENIQQISDNLFILIKQNLKQNYSVKDK